MRAILTVLLSVLFLCNITACKKKEITVGAAHTLSTEYLSEPLGMDNPEPVFACSSVKVISSFLIGNKHRKMVLEQSGATMEAIHFNIENPADLPVFFDKIAFKLKVNRFKKRNTLQIIIEHI